MTWRSFLLRTEPKTSDRDKFVAYTKSWLRPAEAEPAATFNVWSSDSEPPSSSIPAHVAWKSMQLVAPERVEAFHHRLLDAYFTENRTISDWGVLADLADEVGADRDEFLTLTMERERSLTDAVIDDHNEAIGKGITAVPTMVLDEVLPVQGAQEVDTIAHWISRLIDRRGGE